MKDEATKEKECSPSAADNGTGKSEIGKTPAEFGFRLFLFFSLVFSGLVFCNEVFFENISFLVKPLFFLACIGTLAGIFFLIIAVAKLRVARILLLLVCVTCFAFTAGDIAFNDFSVFEIKTRDTNALQFMKREKGGQVFPKEAPVEVYFSGASRYPAPGVVSYSNDFGLRLKELKTATENVEERHLIKVELGNGTGRLLPVENTVLGKLLEFKKQKAKVEKKLSSVVLDLKIQNETEPKTISLAPEQNGRFCWRWISEDDSFEIRVVDNGVAKSSSLPKKDTIAFVREEGNVLNIPLKIGKSLFEGCKVVPLLVSDKVPSKIEDMPFSPELIKKLSELESYKGQKNVLIYHVEENKNSVKLKFISEAAEEKLIIYSRSEGGDVIEYVLGELRFERPRPTLVVDMESLEITPFIDGLPGEKIKFLPGREFQIQLKDLNIDFCIKEDELFSSYLPYIAQYKVETPAFLVIGDDEDDKVERTKQISLKEFQPLKIVMPALTETLFPGRAEKNSVLRLTLLEKPVSDLTAVFQVFRRDEQLKEVEGESFSLKRGETKNIEGMELFFPEKSFRHSVNGQIVELYFERTLPGKILMYLTGVLFFLSLLGLVLRKK